MRDSEDCVLELLDLLRVVKLNVISLGPCHCLFGLDVRQQCFLALMKRKLVSQ